jgi:hypothetical protein
VILYHVFSDFFYLDFFFCVLSFYFIFLLSFFYWFVNLGCYIGLLGLVEPIYRVNTVKSVLKCMVGIRGKYQTVYDPTHIENPKVTMLFLFPVMLSNLVYSLDGILFFFFLLVVGY